MAAIAPISFTKARPPVKVVSFDPGTAHFAYTILHVSHPESVGCLLPGAMLPLPAVRVVERGSGSVETPRRSPDPQMLEERLMIIEKAIHDFGPELEELWVIEYQPPLNTCSNPGLVRKNTYVEAFLETFCRLRHHNYKIVASSAVKRWFNFPKVDRGSQYQSNKRYAVELSRSIMKVEDAAESFDDHQADCILNALFAVCTRDKV